MERLLNELVQKLEKAHREQLVSVILYGSGATGQSRDRMSDLNILCVLDRVTPRELEHSETVFRWWRELQNPAPLLLSEAEVRGSTDCFAIEFTDIRNRRKLLFGRDVIEGMEIDYSFYRASVEYQLRSKLLRLRQKAGSVLSERDLLLRLMAESVSTFCVLFRHALILAGEPPEYEKRAVVAAAARRFAMSPAPFELLLDLREQKKNAKDTQPADLFGGYLAEIQTVVDCVDRLTK